MEECLGMIDLQLYLTDLSLLGIVCKILKYNLYDIKL